MRYPVPVLAVLSLAGCSGSPHDLANGGAPSLVKHVRPAPSGVDRIRVKTLILRWLTQRPQ